MANKASAPLPPLVSVALDRALSPGLSCAELRALALVLLNHASVATHHQDQIRSILLEYEPEETRLKDDIRAILDEYEPD